MAIKKPSNFTKQDIIRSSSQQEILLDIDSEEDLLLEEEIISNYDSSSISSGIEALHS